VCANFQCNTTIGRLIARSAVPGRLRCTFHSRGVREEILAPQIQQDLLRIAQEAISNGLRHAQPTIIRVSLRWEPPNLVFKIRDDGCGFARSGTSTSSVQSLNNGEGFGLTNMRARARSLDAELDIRSAPDRGTTVVVRLPLR
jgi:signal transduction histidine kinase